MPIARAVTWGHERSARSSSLYSNETPPHSDRLHDSNANVRMRRGGGGHSGDDDFEDNIPTSIRRLSPQPSGLSQYSVEDEDGDSRGEHWLRRKCGEVMEDERFQMFILFLIAVNSIMIGLYTFPAVKENPTVASIFEKIDLVVLVIFTAESTAQLTYNGFRRFFRDGWLVFDLIIVAISWVSVEIDGLQAFRVFRALRFITRVSILRNVVVALFSIIPAITAIFTLLLLIFYIFGVMFTQLFKGLYSEGLTSANYFGRLDYTLFTLFQILCLDEWADIAYEVIAAHYWAWAVFVAFIVMSAFVVVNLLIAVICDALSILRTAEDAMLEQKLYGLDPVEEEGEEHKSKEEDDDGESMSNLRLRQRIGEMQKMLDEMVEAQESMSRTIQYLSIALYAERQQSSELVGEDTDIRDYASGQRPVD